MKSVYKTEHGRVYDFSKLNNSKEFQEFLNLSLEMNADEVNIKKCIDASNRFDRHFIIPLPLKRFLE